MEPKQNLWKRQAVRDFVMAMALLGLAMVLALGSDGAARRGDTALAIVTSLAALVLAAITATTIVPRLARRVAFRRWLLPLSFSITREGGFYILAIFLLGLAAINTGNNLLFLILAALLAAIITSGIVARTSLRAVAVSMQVPENVFEGEPVALKISLMNRKSFFPTFSISVEDTAEPKPGRVHNLARRLVGGTEPAEADSAPRGILRQAAYFPLVPARQSRAEIIRQTFPRRGRYRLDGFEISTRFPFGFFRRGEQVAASGEVLVYPQVREVSSEFHLLPFLPGKLEGARVGPGESLYSIRKYQDGEDARLVDWKASAKTGDLMAREYAREEESKFCLILDTLIDKPEDGVGRRFESAVRLAASLTAHFCDEGAELEFLTPYEYIPRGMGETQLYRILRSLAVVEWAPAPPGTSSDLRGELSGIVEPRQLREILSDKVFKIIITAKPRGSFPTTIWRSSRVVYFDELKIQGMGAPPEHWPEAAP